MTRATERRESLWMRARRAAPRGDRFPECGAHGDSCRCAHRGARRCLVPRRASGSASCPSPRPSGRVSRLASTPNSARRLAQRQGLASVAPSACQSSFIGYPSLGPLGLKPPPTIAWPRRDRHAHVLDPNRVLFAAALELGQHFHLHCVSPQQLRRQSAEGLPLERGGQHVRTRPSMSIASAGPHRAGGVGKNAKWPGRE